MKLILVGLFLFTALLYASVGFGGGSTYTALLIVTGTDYVLVPVIALTCNVLVVTGNTIRYKNNNHIDFKKINPLIILSIPAAWLGGRLHISELLFVGLLWIALLIAGVRLLLANKNQDSVQSSDYLPTWGNALIGGAIGFYAGLVGIGGGIFLAPVLHFFRWGSTRQITAACSLFILVNSLSGLGGQLMKLDDLSRLGDAINYWPVLPVVLIGGFIGNHMGVFKLSEVWIKRTTGILILVVAIRLLLRWIALLNI